MADDFAQRLVSPKGSGCPLMAISGLPTIENQCPLLPQKQTLPAVIGMSANDP